MKRIWGPSLVLLGGLCSVLSAAAEDLLEAPTASPPTTAPKSGTAEFGVPPLVSPRPLGPPPAPAWHPAYAPLGYHNLPAAGPFGEPVPRPDDGHGRHGGCASGRGDCGPGGCGGAGCGPDFETHRTCWINEQYEPEWYVAPMIGFQNPRNMNIDYEGLNLGMPLDGGWAGGAAVGWASGLNDMGRHRFEFELAVRTSDVDKVTFGTQSLPFEGDFAAYSAMANLYWDFKHPERTWYPSIGAGFGAAHLNFENDFPLFGEGELEDDVYAWQLMAGMTWRKRPYLEFFVEGKYFQTDTMEVSANVSQTVTLPGGTVIPAGERNFRAGYHTFGVMFGCRILLGKRICDTPPCPDGRPSSGGGWHWQPYP